MYRCFYKRFDIVFPPIYPIKPPITPPTNAPKIGTGMKVCPTKAPNNPEPKDAAVSIVAFPNY